MENHIEDNPESNFVAIVIASTFQEKTLVESSTIIQMPCYQMVVILNDN
jgi:hypothetical protein